LALPLLSHFLYIGLKREKFTCLYMKFTWNLHVF
jgi:hypothetical protein